MTPAVYAECGAPSRGRRVSQSAGLYGKFRNNVANPLPVAQLSVGDFIGLSEDFFPAGDIETIAVGDKYVIDAGFVAGAQLVKNPAPAQGTVVFEFVEEFLSKYFDTRERKL